MRSRKRSVLEVQEFVGWPFLQDLLKKAQKPRDKALVGTMFETGGRISEVLTLRKNQFSFEIIKGRKHVVVNVMPVFKKFHKEKILGPDGHPVMDPKTEKPMTRTVKDPTFRTFSFPVTEPLVKPMLEWVFHVKDITDKLFNLTRQGAWRILTKDIDSRIWGHWFRSQRASQLAHDYGFDVHDLTEWFAWTDIKTAMRYSRLGYRQIASKMVKG